MAGSQHKMELAEEDKVDALRAADWKSSAFQVLDGLVPKKDWLSTKGCKWSVILPACWVTSCVRQSSSASVELWRARQTAISEVKSQGEKTAMSKCVS